MINAIKTFKNENGTPPKSLETLVPSYIKKIPNTEMSAYPKFQYNVLLPDRVKKLYWYDLGGREDRAFSGLWSYPDGDPDHAILVYVVDAFGTIMDTRTDRLPDGFEPIPFSIESWEKGIDRIEMVRSLPEILATPGQKFEIIEKRLGPPHGSRILSDTNWEVTIRSARNALDWNVFVYWPSEKYPEYLYGGDVQEISGWAYVHE